MKTIIDGLLNIAHSVKPKLQLKSKSKNSHDKSPSRNETVPRVKPPIIYVDGIRKKRDLNICLHESRDDGHFPERYSPSVSQPSNGLPPNICASSTETTALHSSNDSNQKKEIQIPSHPIDSSCTLYKEEKNNTYNAQFNKIPDEIEADIVPINSAVLSNTEVNQSADDLGRLENFNVIGSHCTLASLSVSHNDACSCCLPDLKNLLFEFGGNSTQGNVSCACSHESFCNQCKTVRPTDAKVSSSGISNVPSSSPFVSDKRKCFEERKPVSSPIIFSKKYYLGSHENISEPKEEISESPESDKLSVEWSGKHGNSIDFKYSNVIGNSRSENLLSTVWRSKESFFSENSKLPKRMDSVLSFNLLIQSERLSRIGSELSLWRMFKDDEDNNSDGDDQMSNSNMTDDNNVIHSGLFDVLEEDIPSLREKQFLRNNCDLWRMLKRTASTCDLNDTLQRSFIRTRRKMIDRKRRRTSSEKLQPLPEVCPYFSGGRLGPSSSSFRVSAIPRIFRCYTRMN